MAACWSGIGIGICVASCVTCGETEPSDKRHIADILAISERIEKGFDRCFHEPRASTVDGLFEMPESHLGIPCGKRNQPQHRWQIAGVPRELLGSLAVRLPVSRSPGDETCSGTPSGDPQGETCICRRCSL